MFVAAQKRVIVALTSGDACQQLSPVVMVSPAPPMPPQARYTPIA